MSKGILCNYCKQYARWAKDWPGATFTDRIEPPKPTEYLCTTHKTIYPRGALRELNAKELRYLS